MSQYGCNERFVFRTQLSSSGVCTSLGFPILWGILCHHRPFTISLVNVLLRVFVGYNSLKVGMCYMDFGFLFLPDFKNLMQTFGGHACLREHFACEWFCEGHDF